MGLIILRPKTKLLHSYTTKIVIKYNEKEGKCNKENDT